MASLPPSASEATDAAAPQTRPPTDVRISLAHLPNLIVIMLHDAQASAAADAIRSAGNVLDLSQR